MNTTADVVLTNTATTEHVAEAWRRLQSRQLHLLIETDEDGIVSASVLNLPGTGGSGDTEDEAVEDAKNSVRSALEVYGTDIPWADTRRVNIPAGAIQRWVLIDG